MFLIGIEVDVCGQVFHCCCQSIVHLKIKTLFKYSLSLTRTRLSLLLHSLSLSPLCLSLSLSHSLSLSPTLSIPLLIIILTLYNHCQNYNNSINTETNALQFVFGSLIGRLKHMDYITRCIDLKLQPFILSASLISLAHFLLKQNKTETHTHSLFLSCRALIGKT